VRDDHWDLVIGARRGWWDLRLGELWRARELIQLFVRRDFVATYQQTILGPLWYLIQPLVTTLTFTVVFGRIAGLPTDGLPDFLFYMAGTVTWSYFNNCLTRTSNTLAANAGLFGKVYFPRLTVPVSVLITNLIQFAIQFALFLAFVFYFWLAGAAVRPSGAVVLLPLLLFIMAGLGLGMGLIISSLTTRYRDLQNLVGFGAQLLMYATPIIYPTSAVPDRFRPLVDANPLTPVVEAFRGVFLGAGAVSTGGLLYSLGFMIATLTLGLVIFTRVEQTFIDTV
jgi:lipopolysaccharide transport system permease protein